MSETKDGFVRPNLVELGTMTPTAPRLPRLVDSHAHLDAPDFDADREEAVRRAFGAGLAAILCPGDLTQPRSLPVLLGLAAAFPTVFVAAGVHAHQAKDMADGHLDALRGLAARGEIRAVGEIGLDYHYDFSPRERQRDVLRRQLRLAQELGLPVLLHSRLSGPDIVEAVDGEGFTRGGVLHCFTETLEMARLMLDRGFFISFSGILTFPRAREMRAVAGKIPLERLLVETDSPYLPPVPYRGAVKRNEPAFIVETARVLAGIRGLPFPELAAATTRNFAALFPFEKTPLQC
jgi:TatD DNase family protein